MAKNAKAAALRFLKIRPRSVAELTEKLHQKGFTPEEIQSCVGDLTHLRLLDDRAFTKSWIHYRLARPFGFRRIITELKAKGINPDIIEEAVAEARAAYSQEDVVLDLAQRRWQVLSGIDPVKRKKRVLDFLLRRGFSIDAVVKALKKLK